MIEYPIILSIEVPLSLVDEIYYLQISPPNFRIICCIAKFLLLYMGAVRLNQSNLLICNLKMFDYVHSLLNRNSKAGVC